MRSLYTFLFGCRHTNYSWPFAGRKTGSQFGIYVTCLECGKELPYSLKHMKADRRAA